MEWQRPEALYLILPLCAAWLVLALDSNRRRHRARTAFAATQMWSRILPNESLFRFWTKLLLKELAIVMGLVALAGPSFGTQYEQVIPRGADLYLIIDVSRSMLADDVPPSRLGRAKADVSSLLNRLQGERIGLIAFAGQAVVKCPLTIDYDSFRRSLEELDPDSAPRGGTAIGDAIRKGLEVFHSNADRDQAMILITDGDDQQSYPLEAAAVANERHVTIFTIGLGDSQQGARIPQKADPKSYTEYQGEQVWSKLDSNLLEQIALKTSGVYIPAGTRAYDLGELYSNHLQGRHGHDSVTQQRIRRSERFQLFLALALAALLSDLWIAPYPRLASTSSKDPEPVTGQSLRRTASSKVVQIAFFVGYMLSNSFGHSAFAVEPDTAVLEGLRLYSKEQFDEARTQFAAASEELDKRKSAAAAIAAFDEACAAHRKGDLELARNSYLRAGLSENRTIAVAAHFNLGMLAAEKAKSLSGEKPETVAAEKRQEILDQLSQAIASYRHCLELQSDHAPSRRSIELVRQWIKYYSDQWRQRDLQKRRDESNLLTFLEFVIQSQTVMKQTVGHLPHLVRSDTFAELKRTQEELKEEIPTLREKIEAELKPQSNHQSTAAGANAGELDDAIKLLQSWADTAGQKMASAARRLGAKDPANASADQQAAIDELDRIWEAVIPFHPLLTKELADQTTIARTLGPINSGSTDASEATETSATDNQSTESKEETISPVPQSTTPVAQDLEIADDDFAELEVLQTRTHKRAQLLAPKAESELKRLDETSSVTNSDNGANPGNEANSQQPAVDPEQARAGFRKAIELAPQAVDKMEAAINSMKQRDRQNAALRSEEARRILEEIQQSQPKNDQENDRNQDQNEQNQDKNDQDQKSGEDEKDKQKNEDQSEQEQNKEKSDREKKSEKQEQQKPQVSPDRVEDALRKVRERQQEKRERDRKLKGLLQGRTPVDKDW